jgi:hypothetical protein
MMGTLSSRPLQLKLFGCSVSNVGGYRYAGCMNIYAHPVGADPFHLHEVLIALAAFGTTGIAFMWWGFKDQLKRAAAWFRKLFRSYSRSSRSRK